jgi:hypothetical protein
MTDNKLTATIVEQLDKSLRSRGLKLDKRDTPVSLGYCEEWVIQDNDGWNYAGFGVHSNGGYQYSLVNSASLPFDAKQTINWVEGEIVRIVESLTSK